MKAATSIIILLFTVVYIAPLGVRPMIIPDETRYAEIPREMLASGDWTVPTLDGLRYFEKPVLGYWLNTASIYLFGENAFAIRLPSALSVGISALLIGLLVCKFGGGHKQALLTAAAFLTCFEVFVIGTSCILDSVFSMFVTATFVLFFFAWRESASPRKKNAFLVLAGVFCGLAFLAKGFIAFVLPTIVIVPFLLWERQWKELLRIWWVPLAAAALVALPWCVAIHLREGDFWHYFFWTENIQRFVEAGGGQHPNPLWFFIPVLLVGGLPWTANLHYTVSGLKPGRFKDPLVRFAICWLVFPFLFFSASRGKLVTYILPCFPPLIILIITGLLNYLESGKEKTFQTGARISILLLICVAVVLIAAQTVTFIPFKIYSSSEYWKWTAIVAGLLAYAIFLKYAIKTNSPFRKVALCSISPVFLMFAMHWTIPDQFKTGKMPGKFLRDNVKQIGTNTIIVSDNYLTPAVCWFYRRNDIYLLNNPGEFAYGLSYNDAEHRLIPINEFSNFIEQNSNGNKTMLITSLKRYDGYKHTLPEPKRAISNNGFIMLEYPASTVQ
jgi:4-amino-4-deoxy-L-arabinose transferase